MVERTTGPRESVELEGRIAGAVLGAAIGDALGHPTEFLSMPAIRARFGPEGVQGFRLFWSEKGRRFAPYTDDTQMSEAVIRGLLDVAPLGSDLDATMRAIAQRFVQWMADPQGGHRAPGNACLTGCKALARGTPWSEAGGAEAGGCGSAMRAHPFGLAFSSDLQKAETWAVEGSKLTHRHPIALAASAAMAVGVGAAVEGAAPEQVLEAMAEAAGRYSKPTEAMVRRASDEARSGVGPEVTLDRLRGWAAHEAVAGAVYLFARHPDDPRAALLEGANTPGDSDSLASMAGALVGARGGLAELPPDWTAEVERSDDLLALAGDLTRAREVGAI